MHEGDGDMYRVHDEESNRAYLSIPADNYKTKIESYNSYVDMQKFLNELDSDSESESTFVNMFRSKERARTQKRKSSFHLLETGFGEKFTDPLIQKNPVNI